MDTVSRMNTFAPNEPDPDASVIESRETGDPFGNNGSTAATICHSQTKPDNSIRRRHPVISAVEKTGGCLLDLGRKGIDVFVAEGAASFRSVALWVGHSMSPDRGSSERPYRT